MASGLVMAAGLAGWVAAGQPALAQPEIDVIVTVHVEDYTRIVSQEWDGVKVAVEEIFEGAGIAVQWAGPLLTPKQAWPRDGRTRVAVVIANIEVPFAGDLTDTADVLGRAAPRYSRAWVFANRVVTVAAAGQVYPTVLLARAIAHEIGHLLLPNQVHSDHGIMKGSLALTHAGFFGFTRQQAIAMQARIRNEGRAAAKN